MRRLILLVLIFCIFVFSQKAHTSDCLDLVIKGNQCQVSSIMVPCGGKVQLTVIYNDIACCANYGCVWYNHDVGPGPCNHPIKIWSDVESINVDASQWDGNIGDTHELDTGESGKIYGQYMDTYCSDNYAISPWNETVNSEIILSIQPIENSSSAITHIVFEDFSDISKFTLSGSASEINSGGSIYYNGQYVLRLTDDLNQGGATAVYNDPLTLGLDGFITSFSFQITNPQGFSDSDGQGADGIWFTFFGLENNYTIEFDTFENQFDPNGNHVAILENWNYKHPDFSYTQAVNTRMNDGEVKYVWIEYDNSTLTLEVRLSETSERPTSALLSHNIDLYSFLNTQEIKARFYAYTGAGAGDHDIRSWEFTSIPYSKIYVPANNEFSLQENSQETFSLHIANQDTISHSASLEILNPYNDLIAFLSQGSVSLVAPGESKEIPIAIDAASVAAGTYDIQVKVTDNEGNIISYSNIKIYVTANGEENLPNLNISSPDISFSKLNPEQDETINLSAVIHNQGNSPASDVSVKFYDFGNLLGEVTIESLNANALEIASTPVSFSSAGSHLIRVVVDPLNNILELDESDNEASQILQVGSEPDITGNILVTGGLPSTVVANSLFKVTGHAAYEIYINGDRNTDYDVKGGTVQITIKGDGDREWIYPGIYTDINGNFSKLLQAPEDAETYQILMTVTDKTFTGTRNLFFEVIAQSPPTPPSPPTSSGSGTWNPDSSGGGWTWEWTQPPVHEPILESNLYVHSEDIYFSKSNPALGDEISIITEIHYWSSSTAITAENVPVNFYVTYPGFLKMKIGETIIQNISVGEPDFGSSHVFVSWKNQAEGIYIVEVEIDPEYIEENQFDNAATRAIIVGQVAQEGDYGVISGHVTNPWGGVGGVFIKLFDSEGTFPSNAVTDETGSYLFADIPAAGYTVQIIVPDGYSADAETKTTTVSSNAISAVDFKITDIEGPITTDAATGLNPVQIGNTVNLSAFVDDANTGESDILSAEYSLDGGETWVAMDTVDGSFDSPSEWVTSTFPVPGVPGVYELCVRGTDSYENIGPEECFLLVVYDPEGGFVTGGGWIWSPPGAYADDISLEGKANFGFVSKYKKGAEVPTGHTEFQFKTADLNFHSDSYEWLVVTGSNYAKFKGKGTINGDYDPNGNLYKFMLWAGDDVPDTFRIRIWWEEEGDGTEHDVYDNGFDQAITGGSIVIHTKEK